jgi:hypothetical protein
MTHACKSACKNDGSYTHACASGDDTSTARAIELTPRLTLIRPQPDGAAAPSRLPGGATGPNAVAMTVRVPEEVVSPTSARAPPIGCAACPAASRANRAGLGLPDATQGQVSLRFYAREGELFIDTYLVPAAEHPVRQRVEDGHRPQPQNRSAGPLREHDWPIRKSVRRGPGGRPHGSRRRPSGVFEGRARRARRVSACHASCSHEWTLRTGPRRWSRRVLNQVLVSVVAAVGRG